MYMRKVQLAPATVSASIGPETVNESDRTVQCSFGTGTPVLRTSPVLGTYNEVLDMNGADLSRAERGIMPVLDSHDNSSLDSVLGTVVSAAVKNDVGLATLKVTDDNAWSKIKDGTVKGISIGYRVLQMKDISGKADAIPTYQATKFEVYEVSLVGAPADPTAMLRSNNLNQPNECELIPGNTQGTERKMDKEKAEELRTLKIEKLVRTAGIEDAVAHDLIERGISVEDARAEIFKELEARQVQVDGNNWSISPDRGRSTDEGRKTGFVDYLLQRHNPNYKLRNVDAARMFQGRSLLNAVEIYMQGRHLGESDMQLASRAITTSDLPNILANYGEKAMRAEYQVQVPTFKPWTKPGTLRNYKNAYRLMLGDFPSLDALDEHGEVKQGALGETKENIQLARYAKSITFTKETLVNDDLSALNSFSVKSARAALRLESSLVYSSTLLANPNMGDGNALFSSAHGNLAGSGTAIDLDNVSAGWLAIRSQKTVDGSDYLDLIPKFLICGLAQEAAANQFVSTNMLATKFSDTNPLAGKLTVIVDPRISGNQWYLSADPAQVDTLEVATLEAEQGPIIRVVPNLKNGNLDIICEHSVGVAALDYRGLYKNPGV